MLSLPCEASTEVQTSDRRLTQKCQAELEDVEESAAATYEHDPEAADEVAAELCDAIRDMVAYVLQPSTVWELCWSLAGSSTIMDVQVLAADPLFASLAAGQRERLLDDQSAQTAVERGVQSRHMTSTTAAPTDAEPSHLREDACHSRSYCQW